LRFCSIQHWADVPLEPRYVSEQEGGKSGTAAARPLSSGSIELQFARAMPVAGHAKVVGPANVGPELEGVVALNLRPVIDELILILILDQRAVTAVDAQRVTEAERNAAAASVPVDIECRHA
jgi:hypothetical protein